MRNSNILKIGFSLICIFMLVACKNTNNKIDYPEQNPPLDESTTEINDG